MNKYIIQGNISLKGRITASGNKNAALPCIAATLLTDEEVILRNIPDIEDVKVMLEVLKSLGVEVLKKKLGEYSIKATSIKTSEISEEHARNIRASILFAGSLLARTGKVLLPPPGGDLIGRRRLDTHFLALEALGAKIKTADLFKLNANKLVGSDIFMDEASVTATENTIMAASLSSGKTTIMNAASEPHIQDLCNMLNSMGARITGIGSNILYIHGVKKLGGTEFEIGSDYMEIGSYIGLAAVTGGDIEIEKACPEHLQMTKIAFNKLGIRWETDGSTIRISPRQKMKVSYERGGMIPKIDDAPWPGFPADLTSIMTVVATQVKGTVLIHEKMFESRMFFVDKLIEMGARIILCDPHRAVVNGPSLLKGAKLVSPDVRAGMAMVIAALSAEGTSEIHNVYQIERGYESIVKKLSSLGAKIERK